MRYVGQEHALSVAVPGDVDDEEARGTIKATFDREHDVRFGHGAPDEPAELVSLRVSVIGRIARPPLPTVAKGDARPSDAARAGERTVVLDDAGPVACDIYERDALLAGNVIEGPAIVEEGASSTVVRAGDRLTVNEHGHLVIEVGGR